MMSLAVFRPVLLTLSLLLCSASASAPSEFVEEGESITLSCGNVREGQRECDGTSWIFNSAEKPGETKELITHGKIGTSVSKTLSNRLRVTQNCSLEIQNVQPQDAGRFSCRQFDQSGSQLFPDALVHLSVVSLTKEKYEKTVLLRCNVSSSLSGVDTKWLINGKEVNNSQIITVNLQNSTTVTVPNSHFLYKDVNLFKCEVTHGEKKKRFSISVKTKTKTSQEETGGDDTEESRPTPGWLWVVIAAVAGVFVTVVVVVVVVVTWRRLRVKPAHTRNDSTVEYEEAVSYATVSYNTNNQRTEVRQSEAVIYSSVRNTSVEDPAQLYATSTNEQQPTRQPNQQPTQQPPSKQPNNQPTQNK